MATGERAARELNLRRSGTGDPLVLLHGIGMSLQVWDPVMPALSRAHDVVAIDLPGFGESPPLPVGERPTPAGLAQGVERELDRLELGTVHLAGNSLGGWVALELAARGRARSVAAISPAGMARGWENAYATRLIRVQGAIARRLAPRAERLTKPAAARTAMFSVLMSRPWRLGPAEAAHAVEAIAGASGMEDTLAALDSNSIEGLERIRCPVAVIWGTRDRLLLPRQGPRFVERIEGAELRPLPGLGHVPMSDDPALVAEAILASVARAG